MEGGREVPGEMHMHSENMPTPCSAVTGDMMKDSGHQQ